MPTVNVASGDITAIAADAIVVNLFEVVTSPAGGTGAVDRALDGAISSLIADGDIKGKSGEITLIHAFGKLPAKRVIVAGLGKQSSFGLDEVRSLSGNVARYLRRHGIRRAATLAHGAGIGGLDTEAAAQAIAEGTMLGHYAFRKYRSSANGDQPEKELDELTIVEHDPAKLDALRSGVATGALLADCAILVRDMVNEPANVMNPAKMAEIAANVAREVGLDITVLGREEMMTHGMGALLAVAQGSANEPRLIVLEHHGDPSDPSNNIAIVGKGVTFDTGGVSLKQAAGMWEMKSDMGGGASVIGAMRAIGRLKPKINVFGVIPAVENMPSGTAQRPGDIVRAMSGKTIEVDNTDAEGRLILADAISYIKQAKKANRVVDIATLTGAIIVALGHVTTGVMGRSQPLIDAVLAASKATGEKMWQLPLHDEYKEQNRSDWADVKNTGGRPAGSITAALFIGEFTDGVEWAHLDIAGTAMSEKERGWIAKGATGVPMRTLVRLVRDLSKS